MPGIGRSDRHNRPDAASGRSCPSGPRRGGVTVRRGAVRQTLESATPLWASRMPVRRAGDVGRGDPLPTRRWSRIRMRRAGSLRLQRMFARLLDEDGFTETDVLHGARLRRPAGCGDHGGSGRSAEQAHVPQVLAPRGPAAAAEASREVVSLGVLIVVSVRDVRGHRVRLCSSVQVPVVPAGAGVVSGGSSKNTSYCPVMTSSCPDDGSAP